MAKSILKVPVAVLALGEFSLEPEAANYVSRVHRKRVGDALLLFEAQSGRAGAAEILSVGAELRVRVEAIEERSSRPYPVELLQAQGKGDKPEQAYADVTVLGAQALVLCSTERVQGGKQRELKRERLERVAVEAARQCGRMGLPELLGPLDWEAALARPGLKLVFCFRSNTLPLWTQLERLSLPDLEERAESEASSPFPITAERPLQLLVGPEGGFSEAELEQALRAGALPVSLGPHVLRTETAATAALAVVTAWLEARRSA